MTRSRAQQVRAIEVMELVEQIKPILAGKHPSIQGAALADCLAIWLAGYYPKEMRDNLLKMHLEHVAELVELLPVILDHETAI